MPHDMIHEMFFSCKRFFANVASMWGLSGVNSNMIYHMFLSSKCLCTILTTVERCTFRNVLLFMYIICSLKDSKNYIYINI